MSDTEIFHTLRKSRLDFKTIAEWDAYYAQLLPWLSHSDLDIRKMALERVVTASFWAEPSGPIDARPPQDHMTRRVQWVFDQTDRIHAVTGDMIGLMLREMRYNWPHTSAHIAQDWLRRLIKDPPRNVTRDVLEGTRLINQTPSRAVMKRALKLLDDPSNYLRACAARRLSGVEPELTEYSETELFTLIQSKEIARPGIAGPFWTEWHFDFEDAPIDPIEWMMEILEHRTGPEPDIPFNGIDFYLHEVCDFSPNTVRRMIALGHLRLAVETATEIHAPVAGMQAVLEDLGYNTNTGIARRAHIWLALYYNHIHAHALDTHIKRLEDWHQDCAAIWIRYGDKKVWSEGVALYPSTALTHADAWTLAIQTHPKFKTGRSVDLARLRKDVKPAFELSNKIIWLFEGGIRIEFARDYAQTDTADETLWTRLFTYAPRLSGTH